MSSLGISIELLNFRSSTTPWCNGNTAGFGPAIQGSSPCGVALKPLERFVSGAFCVLLPLILPLSVKQQNEIRSRTNKARLLGLSPLRSSAAMSRSPFENVAVLLRVFLWGIGVPKGAAICASGRHEKAPHVTRTQRASSVGFSSGLCSVLARRINCSPGNNIRGNAGRMTLVARHDAFRNLCQ